MAFRFVLLVYGLIGLSAAIQPAVAQVTTFYRAGGWDAFGGRADDGKAVCGISTFDPHTSRSLLIKYFEGGSYLFVQIVKPTWAIPKGTQVPVSVGIDSTPLWSGMGFGNGTIIELRIGREQLATFEKEFRAGLRLMVWFHSGNEPPWIATLVGSAAIDGAFHKCVSMLLASRGGPPSQPFVGAGRTQPFGSDGGNPSAPTQQPRPEPADTAPVPDRA